MFFSEPSCHYTVNVIIMHPMWRNFSPLDWVDGNYLSGFSRSVGWHKLVYVCGWVGVCACVCVCLTKTKRFTAHESSSSSHESKTTQDVLGFHSFVHACHTISQNERKHKWWVLAFRHKLRIIWSGLNDLWRARRDFLVLITWTIFIWGWLLQGGKGGG